MTITQQDELDGVKDIGRIVANTLQAMSKAMEPGMTTRELDDIGSACLEREGAMSAPRTTYGFPGTTCISVNEEIAHGIPGDRVIAPGDLVNIDVSASKNGYFADTGATHRLAPLSSKSGSPKLDRPNWTACAAMADARCRSGSHRSAQTNPWRASALPLAASHRRADTR